VRAVVGADDGRPPAPRLGDVADPVAAAGEVVLEVAATALNRVDLLQLRGLYPPPAGESEIPGLEAAGRVVALGPGVSGWSEGERVMALLAGGGQAERVAVPVGQLLRIPESWSDVEAGAFPEAALTAWTNLVTEGRLTAGEVVLVNGATSGVGTVTVQLARLLGATVVATGRDPLRLERLQVLGASALVPLTGDLPAAVASATGGREIDLVVDLLGGETMPRLLPALAQGGRWIVVGLMAGRRTELDLGALLRRRWTVRGSVLRPRSRAEKADLVRAFSTFAASRLERRELLPIVDRVFPFEQVAEAYGYLETGRPLGKVVLRLD